MVSKWLDKIVDEVVYRIELVNVNCIEVSCSEYEIYMFYDGTVTICDKYTIPESVDGFEIADIEIEQVAKKLEGLGYQVALV